VRATTRRTATSSSRGRDALHPAPGRSTSLLQRRLRIGYGRAARVIDQLHAAGVLGPPDGSKPRDVLVDIIGLDQLAPED
jgi:S-DNA-T family DNA segregation ATPase FtsK/SpoIIIE